jgi:D-ribose pyranose/furanose isomerase RbsD
MPDSTQSEKTGWQERLSTVLPQFGHRNWIAVADSAYPLQSNPGIETIVAGGDHIAVIEHVLAAIAQYRHIRANVYADKELAYVAETDAPGVLDYFRNLEAALKGANVNYLPHEQIIHKLDESARLFRILLIKTDMKVPYTSVFFELDCGYWNAEAEQRLRKALSAASE